ncbi:uncharacterized protein METZ01_LOCUS331409 [marine metagenome]|uniref:Uncharacterized protein n=1 Tax=marine metagenome TaxID=408172 RepID=A0A382Q0U2_9ZZZZ
MSQKKGLKIWSLYLRIFSFPIVTQIIVQRVFSIVL